jgi:stage V sporulation protein B
VKFFRNVLGTLATEVWIVSLNFLAGVIIARLLPPEERGVLALVMLLPVTLAYLADFGISQAIVYLLGRKKRPLRAVAANGIALALLLGSGAAVIVWLARGLLFQSFLSDVPESYFYLVLGLMPILLVDAYLLAILRGQQLFALFNFRRLLSPIFLLVGVALLIGVAGWGTRGAVIAFVASTLVSLVVSAGMVSRLVPLSFSLNRALAREAVGFGLKSYLQNLVGHLNYRLDVYMLALFLPPTQVAFYAIATSVAELAWYIPNSVGMVLFPKLSAETGNRIHELTAEVTRHTVLVTGLASIVILGLGWVLIPLVYGSAYSPATTPLLILMPGILAMAVYKVLSRNFTSRDRQQVSILAASLALILNVVFNLYFIPRAGMVGAATASLLSYTASAVILVTVFRKETGIPLAHVLFIQRTDLARYGEAWSRLQVWLVGRFGRRERPNKQINKSEKREQWTQ